MTTQAPSVLGRRDAEVPFVWLAWSVVVVATLLALLLTPHTFDTARNGHGVVSSAALLCQLAMLVCAVGLGVHHRTTGSAASGWLAAGIVVAPVVVSLTGLASVLLPAPFGLAVSATGFGLGGIATLLCVALSPRVVVAGPDPLAWGFATGVLVSVVSLGVGLGLGLLVREGRQPIASDVVAGAFVVVVGVLLASVAGWRVVQADLPAVLRAELLVAGATFALGAGLVAWAGTGLVVAVLATSLHAVSATAFFVAGLGLLTLVRGAMSAGRLAQGDRMWTAERDLHSAEAVLHEARSTMAGLASAAHLLDGRRHDVSESDRARLAAMSTAEMARMQRLLDRSPTVAPRASVSEVIGPLVESMRSRGHDVTFLHSQPEPCRAVAGADDVAEVVHILLDNAARHGAGSSIVVAVLASPSLVGVSVVDHGPGVLDDLRSTLFERGTSRPGSPGRGIGLHLARDRAHEMGGEVRLASSEPGRTSFELTLPRVAVEAW